MKKLSLMEVLDGIEDTRRERSVKYPLHEVLIIMLPAIICGTTSYAKIEMFGNSKKEIPEKIISKEVDYIFALKENQKILYNDVKLYIDDIRKEKKF